MLRGIPNRRYTQEFKQMAVKRTLREKRNDREKII